MIEFNTSYGALARRNRSAGPDPKSDCTQSLQEKPAGRAAEQTVKQADAAVTAKTNGTGGPKIDLFELSEEARLAFEQGRKLAMASSPDEAEPDGEEETEQKGGKVAVNEGKRARQIAAAKSRGDVQRILAMLRADMADCKAGLESGMCDAAEIAKVEGLINMAKARMGQVPQESDDEQAGLDEFDLASLL